jgi:hypothetical protein
MPGNVRSSAGLSLQLPLQSSYVVCTATGGGAAVFSDQGVKTGPEFDPRQLGTGAAGTGHHEEVYEDHGHHVTGTAGVTGAGPFMGNHPPPSVSGT